MSSFINEIAVGQFFKRNAYAFDKELEGWGNIAIDLGQSGSCQ